jgi:hypothetical protein
MTTQMTQKIVLGICLFLLAMPALAAARPDEPGQSHPPIAPPLVREGDFALQLASALGIGTAADDVEAEKLLGDTGITPRNGWIADYPVTPDILGELQKSVSDAAEAGKLNMSVSEAVKRLNNVSTENGLAVTPYIGAAAPAPQSAENYPDPTVVNEYYSQEGLPVYTYYVPPPDYYYMYAYVPYPFWGFGFWFPGFFVLHDFHRPFFFHGRQVICSNHFNDRNIHKVFRVDPVKRFNGRTFAGIGAPRTGRFINTGVPRSDTTVFNAPRTRAAPGMVDQHPRGSMVGAPSHDGTATYHSQGAGHTESANPAGGRAGGASHGGGGHR